MRLKITLTALALILSMNAAPVHALVVSDPGSYARQAQQIMEMQKQLKEFQAAVAEAKKTADAVSGLSTRGNGANLDITDLRKASESMLMGLLKSSGQNVNEDTIKVINKGLEETFKTIEQDPVAARATRKQRELYRDNANKGALQYAEYTLNKMPQSLERIQQLSGQINQTTTIKDSQDLTNRYLAELLGSMNQMLMLQGQLVRAQSAADFVNKAPTTPKTVSKEDFNRWTDSDEVYKQQFKNLGK